MIRKLLLTLSGVTLLVAATAGTAYARPVPVISPLSLSSGNGPRAAVSELCAQAGEGYCLNDWDGAGSGGPVKMYDSGDYANNNWKLVQLTGYCDHGVVTNGPGPACPFPVGSGLNAQLNGDVIDAIVSYVSAACIGTDYVENMNLGPCPPPSNGAGSNIWVQGPGCNSNGSFYYTNVYWSAQHGNSGAAYMVSGGAIGAQAYVSPANASCWRYQLSS
jgi:hypothetical protein